jgi:protein ImuB
MFAALFLPDFHLQAQLRLHPEKAGLPLALLECPSGVTEKERGKARILQITPEAAQEGVQPGMTATRAQARCQDLQIIHRNPEDEEAAREILWECAGGITRDFEASGPGLVTLDLHGVRGSPHRLAMDRIDWLRELGLSAQAGAAGNPDLAFLAARLADPVLVFDEPPERIRTRLAPLPIAALQPSEEWLEPFRIWGIRTIGDLAALPRHELVERLGAGAGRIWDEAQGCSRRLLRLVRSPEVYRESLDWEDPVASLEPVFFVLRRLVERICARLTATHLAAGSLDLRFWFEGAPSHQRIFRMPDPSRDPEILLRILQTHLESFTAPGPIAGLSLEACATRASGGQTQLFTSSWKDPNRLADTLARLEALLGADRVGTPMPGFSHRPDTFQMRPFALTEPRSRPPAIAGNEAAQLVPGPPLRRYRPRRPVAVRPAPSSDRPEEILSGPFQGALSGQRGPWLSSGDWWTEAEWTRKEWDVRHQSGLLYRLVQEGGKWFLEGCYD